MPIIADFVLLVGKGAVMVLRLGPWRLLVQAFWMICFSPFGCPSGSGGSLLAGTLRMRYCSANFSNEKPTWRLQPSGGVAALVAIVGDAPPEGSVQVSEARSSGGEFEDGVRRKRIRLTKKTNVRKRFGFDLWGSQFPKDGRQLHCGVLLFKGWRRQLLAAGWDVHMWMSHRELAEQFRLHGPTPPGYAVHVQGHLITG